MAIECRQLDLSERQHWQDYIHKHAQSSAYHDFSWGKAIQRAYGHKPYYFTAWEDDRLVGVLPVVEMRKPLMGRTLCSLPFCDLGGCLADNQEISSSLINQVQQQLGASLKTPIELRQCQQEPKLNDDEANFTGLKVRMLLPLPQNSEALMASFKSKLRSQIRKSEKNGLQVELGNQRPLIDAFYQVFAENMRKLGSPVHAKGFFEALLAEYGENMIVSVVRKDDKAIGAGIVLLNNKVASIPWASTLQEYNKLAPNMMLYWSLLSYVTDKGIGVFDFGRSTYGKGTYKFKAQWGAKPTLLEWQTVPSNNASVSHVANQSQLRELIESCWRQLPLGVTTRLGPIIRKYISL